jgi:hypothetical protein
VTITLPGEVVAALLIAWVCLVWFGAFLFIWPVIDRWLRRRLGVPDESQEASE